MKLSHLITGSLALVLFSGCAAIDRQERNTLITHNVSPVVYDRMLHGEVLTLSDIIELSRRQVPSPLIIRYLASTRAIYTLDKQALARLNEARVSKDVVNYLLETPTIYAPRYYARPYYYDGGPWYPYDGYYPYRPYPAVYGSSVIVVGGGRWHH